MRECSTALSVGLFNTPTRASLRGVAYIFDINSRLSMYKRIASVKNTADMRELQVEMIDRFGLLPDQVKNLCQQTVLRISLETLGIDRVDMNNRFGTIDFGRKTVVDPIKIVQLVQA